MASVKIVDGYIVTFERIIWDDEFSITDEELRAVELEVGITFDEYYGLPL